MRIQEAIALVELEIHATLPPRNNAYFKALKLSIEAMKRHKVLQSNPFYTGFGPLPGETED